MTPATNDITINVAPGTGRIARRPHIVLFDPTGDNAALVAEFDTAETDAEAITAVKQHLIDAEFRAAPLVVVDWRGNGLALLVFGDTHVRSSVPAAPMVSGAGSGTWIERHLGDLEFGDATEAHVWCGDDADDATDLRLGVARCGGLRVVLTREIEEAPPENPPAEIPPPEPEAANPRPIPAPAPAPIMTAVPGNGSAPEPIHREKYEIEAEPATAAVATITDPFTDSSHDRFEDQLTEPAGSIDGLEVVRGATTGLVEALLCSNGHSNPPQLSTCRECAIAIDPDAAVELVPQPSAGHLRFSDGTVVEVDGPQVVGRKPSADDRAVRPVIIDHAEVSRSHVEITLQGWAVLVTDIGSRNGTWVIPPSDPTPIKLDARVPYLLEHGTTVHLGGPEASFTYDFGID